MVWGIDEVTDCLKDVKLRQDPLLPVILYHDRLCSYQSNNWCILTSMPFD